MDFWIRRGKPALLLAPMEGVTDAPMRTLLTERPGFTHCVTEFLRISHMELPKKVYRRHAIELNQGSLTPSGIPVHFQLLGGNAELLALSAARAVEVGAQSIDLNFGCPAPTVNSHDGGATLLKYPDRLEQIVKAVREAVPSHLPVSAKLRLGWDEIDSVFENAERAARAGASWITVHGRTKSQGYRPPAYWEPIGILNRSLGIPVIANGEIWTLDDFKRCRDITHCEHFMIGRGALANPNLSAHISHELGLQSSPSASFPEPNEWMQLLTRFMDISEPLSDNPNYSLRRVKQWLKYVASKRQFEDFDRIKRIECCAELRSLIPSISYPT